MQVRPQTTESDRIIIGHKEIDALRGELARIEIHWEKFPVLSRLADALGVGSQEIVYTDDDGTPIEGAGRPSYDQDIEDVDGG